MGGVQPSKLAESSTVTGLSYLEDGQFAKIYKVSFNSNQYLEGSWQTNLWGKGGISRIGAVKILALPKFKHAVFAFLKLSKF